MKGLFSILACCLLSLHVAESSESVNPPSPDMVKFRAGDISEVCSFFQAPTILVSEFKTERERTGGAELITITIHSCRVVASNISDLPVNSIVMYRIIHEKAPEIVPPNGQLLYIISPSARQVSTLNGAIELYEYCIPLPLRATPQQIDTARRRVNARLHN